MTFGQDVCYVQGECQEGIQIDFQETNSYTQCQSLCQDNPNCNYFTYYEPTRICKLLYNCSDIDATDCPECFTSQRDCLICNQPGQCVGRFVDDILTSSNEDCQKACYDNPDCEWYTFSSDLQYCQLTSDCLPKNTTNINVFGQKNCYEDNVSSNSSKIWLHKKQFNLICNSRFVNIGLWTKLMIVTGRPTDGDCELIDISGQNLNCPSITDFSADEAPVGIFIGNKSLVCGGYPYTSNCYSYNMNVSKITFFQYFPQFV